VAQDQNPEMPGMRWLEDGPGDLLAY